jgi:Protein of unknown function (DUF1588)/Protein of unknown function (DUF1592)
MFSRREHTPALRYAAACLLCAALAGCRSREEDSPAICQAGLPSTPASTDLPSVWSMRRLSRDELSRTFHALLGMVPESLRRMPAQDTDLWATAPAASSFEVDLYRQIADEAADAGSRRLLSRWACGRDLHCLRTAAAHWLERAQRGPLADDERDAYLALLSVHADPRPALRAILELVFQSARFLYVIESGVSRQEHEEFRDLTPWELAVRLSYFLWMEPPDEELHAQAGTGQLHEPSILRAQALRLIRDPRAAQTLGRNLQHWAAPELDILAKADSVYPEFGPELRSSMIAQFVRFAALAIADDYSLADLITTQRAPVDGPLRALFGLEKQRTDAADWQVVELGPTRFGLLTLPGVLTSNARADDSSPVQRGLFIRQNVLCQSVPPPPPGIPVLPPATSSAASFRDRFAEHTRSPACAACHGLMDPLGFAFEVYDGLGRLRAQPESIDTAGTLDGVTTPVRFSDLRGLTGALLQAPEVSRCWAHQWLQRALGPEAGRDAALLDRLAAQVTAGVSLNELLVKIVTAPAFGRVRRPHAE